MKLQCVRGVRNFFSDGLVLNLFDSLSTQSIPRNYILVTLSISTFQYPKYNTSNSLTTRTKNHTKHGENTFTLGLSSPESFYIKVVILQRWASSVKDYDYFETNEFQNIELKEWNE